MKYTLEDAKRLVRERIEEVGPDFSYEIPGGDFGICANWVYDDEGKRQPSCLVGHVLHKIGKLDVLTAEEEFNNASTTCSAYFDEDAVEYLTLVQTRQDRGMKYGDLGA